MRLANQPILTTSRLELRPFVEEDAQDVFAYASDPEVAHFTTWHRHESIEMSRIFITHVAFKEYERGSIGPLAIHFEGRVIGSIDIRAHPDETWELGYCLARPYWGRGLMTEAGKVVLDHAKGFISPAKIKAKVNAENLGSIKVVEKLEFHLIESKHDVDPKSNQPREMLYYGL
ncbi:MAG: GNAT family N-acetyltransferase [Holosporales bacterium]